MKILKLKKIKNGRYPNSTRDFDRLKKARGDKYYPQ
jgi:hypothetical protein